jgi:hypothetical protein
MKASPRHNCNWQHVVAKDIIDPKHVMEKKLHQTVKGCLWLQKKWEGKRKSCLLHTAVRWLSRPQVYEQDRGNPMICIPL